jgi:hypothetical protein
MAPELTEQQQQAIKAHPDAPVELMDPTTHSRYVLIPAETYERIKALLTTDEFHIEEGYPLMDQVAAQEGWNDPAMDAYDQLDPRRKP